jgi:mannose/cellobiose epimerase-like protein (N-acyl-D-glucosamine 2-epimerase family)
MTEQVARVDAAAELQRLLDFARGSAATPAGFAWLDDRGVPDLGQPVHTWITTRMTHVFSLAHLQAVEDAAGLAAHGVRALAGPLRDAEHGGWYAAVSADGRVVDATKAAYAHAFVVLAGSSAAVAGVPGGQALLDAALEVVGTHFLDGDGRVVDTLAPDLGPGEAYRGANSSMHMVEALLAAGDVTGDRRWHDTALGIAEHLVHGVAREHGYLLPEHFTADWVALPDYNLDDPADPFRPFGCTPGHLLEWSRLLLHLEATVADPPAWLLEDAVALFGSATEVGWTVDLEPGFVYTVDWQRQPVVRSRMHWVHAEGLAAAAALHRRTGEASYAAWQRVLEEYVATYLVDRHLGSWHHELDEHNRPAATTWHGKPDVYHAYQALLLAQRPLAPVLSVQLAEESPVQRHAAH